MGHCKYTDMYYYTGVFAGEELCYAFRHKDTVKYFGTWLTQTEEQLDVVFIPEEDLQEQYQKFGLPDSPYAEYLICIYHTSDRLLRDGICAFHAAAFLWKGKAFFFTGPSGTGKSTQLRNWCDLYGDETKIINGDKPFIKAEGDYIQVYPSPWRGKEGFGNDTLTAPLGGIICLTQGKENSISRMRKAAAGKWLLCRFLCRYNDKEIVLSACSLVNRIVDTVPVWMLTNTGDQASTQLVHDTLIKELFADV